MKTLKESLLDRTAYKVKDLKDKIGKFGEMFEIFNFKLSSEGVDFVTNGFVDTKKLDKLTAGMKYIHLQNTQAMKTFNSLKDNGKEYDNEHREQLDVLAKILLWIENIKCPPMKDISELCKFLEDELRVITKQKLEVSFWSIMDNYNIEITYKRNLLIGFLLDRSQIQNSFIGESILNRTSDKISGATTTIKNLKYLGGMYDLATVTLGMKNSNAVGTIKLKNLINLNKDKKLSHNSRMKLYDCDDERVFELIKYLENIDMTELGFPTFDCSNKNEMYDFVDALEQKMKNDGVFNRPNAVRVSGYQFPSFDNEFDINIYRASKGGSGMSITLKKKVDI